ncbi:hypothetical protein RJT34_22813 [Clitoria ternatea]|uniref:Brf1 TBP-binding domain-containing protein n=1 Tax=Clitoria ternatea TaxID=43366 RepID=A0AAN9IKY2_CLITE
MMAKEQKSNPTVMPNSEINNGASKDVLCEHKNNGVPHFALGLCEECYEDHLNKLSGGHGGGLDPPAFRHAEREKMKGSLPQESVDEAHKLAKASNGLFNSHEQNLPAYVPKCVGANIEQEALNNGEYHESHREDKSESLSDIDDEEIDGYLHNEEEKNCKKIIWEQLNREYLEEQAAKKAYEANFKNCSDGILAARKLADSAAAAVAKSRKEMRERRAQAAKRLGPAKSAAGAACQRLERKPEVDNPKKLKKNKIDLPPDNDDKVKDENGHEMGSADELDNAGDMAEIYENGLYDENMNDKYFPDDDGYSYNDGDDYY